MDSGHLQAPAAVADEVTRPTELGASVRRVRQNLTVMADPQGNECCAE